MADMKHGTDDLLRGKTILAYADRLSVAQGGTLAFQVSSAAPYRASIMRLTGRPDAEGAGDCEEPVAWGETIAGDYPGREQTTDLGSYARIDAPLLFADCGLTLQIVVRPTTPALGRPQFLLGQWSQSANQGAALYLDEAGHACFVCGDGGAPTVLRGERPLVQDRAMLLTATFDRAQGLARLRQVALDTPPRHEGTIERAAALLPAAADTPFVIGASRDSDAATPSRCHFNGKLEAPAVLCRPVTAAEAERLLADPQPAVWKGDLVAAWDFSRDIDAAHIVDIGPNRHHGRLVNLPTRAMTGWRWAGQTYCWTHAPDYYGAIHFHEDDIHDTGWASDFELSVPIDATSGVYAARLETSDDVEYVPFFVSVAPGRETADLLLLMPTASYLAYANEHLGQDVAETEPLGGHLSILQKGDISLGTRRELGLSLYDRHSDDSGVCHSSRLRPILNMRPGKRSAWIGRARRAPWQFNADLNLVAFLEHEGYRYDIATDEDLHDQGLDLLGRYRTVMTGTHPEYYSTEMLDAVEGFLHRGGRLMYMGGNGFYWRIAFNDDWPGAIELRRAEDGIRDWTCAPGEYHHSFTGELGGLWRRIGRSPQSIFGVGMASQGFDYSGYFKRTPDADNPRAAFIFRGIDDDIIGDFGEIGGGAAGLEIDRTDEGLGTPAHTLTVASSQGHSNLTFAVPEEVDNVNDELVATRNANLRGDLTLLETPRGGAVFSFSSIAWAGSLRHNGYANNVAQLTRNVIDRFLDPEPFAEPEPD